MIVLDTHALVWWVSDDPLLSKAARTAIEQEIAGGEIIVSCISVWEIAMLVERQRLLLSMLIDSWCNLVAEIRCVKLLAIDTAVALRSVDLPGQFHKDPADRIIVATARQLAAPLVTKDHKIRSYPHVTTIW